MKGIVAVKLMNTQYTFHLEGEDLKVLLDMAVLGNPPHSCDCCDNKKNFKLDGNKDRDSNIYINTVCLGCGAKAKLGLYKSGGYFWHQFKKWEGSQSTNEPPTRDVNSDLDEDIEPF